jgi:hypothetical protein
VLQDCTENGNYARCDVWEFAPISKLHRGLTQALCIKRRFAKLFYPAWDLKALQAVLLPIFQECVDGNGTECAFKSGGVGGPNII